MSEKHHRDYTTPSPQLEIKASGQNMYSEILSAKQGGTPSPATYQTHYGGQDPQNSQQA